MESAKAFLIGVSCSDDDSPIAMVTKKGQCAPYAKGPLQKTRTDVKNMKAFLLERGIPSEIQVSNDRQDPTVDTIKQRLSDFFDEPVRWNLVYFSGHGKTDQGDWLFHVGPNDCQFLSLEDLVELWNCRKDQSKRLLIISDCCFSGCWVKKLNETIKNQSIYMQSSCGLDLCYESANGAVFTEQYTQKVYIHKRYRHFYQSIFSTLMHPFITYHLFTSKGDGSENDKAFMTFQESLHQKGVHSTVNPSATHHGHLPIGKGLHIGPERCWTQPHAGVLQYMNSIATDDASNPQLVHRELAQPFVDPNLL